MENIGYIVFICFALPFLLAIPIVRKNTRLIMLYVFIGMCCCLFISEVNGLLNTLVRTSNAFDDRFHDRSGLCAA